MNHNSSKRWEVWSKITPEVSEELNEYPPVMRQLLFNRGLIDEIAAYNFLTTEGPFHDPFQMTGMDVAVGRLLRALEGGEKIVVYGDYDVDGVTATALMVQVLKAMGGFADGYIPNRFEEGYGVNKEALKSLAEEGVAVVLTVDCGIRSPEEAEYARALGLDLIISDHHEPRLSVPVACAVICPKQAGDAYPDKNLSGVGLAFKIAEALLKTRPVAGADLNSWLDLVAVGTVADIVPLKGENRALVKAGLKLLNKRQRQGIYSLLAAAGVDSQKRLTARDIGFVIGPRLNAAGRMDSAVAAYRLLMAADEYEAGPLAQQLDNQNRERQKKTAEMQQIAEALAQADKAEHLLFAIDHDFNKGIVGLVAARLVETYYRPAIVGQQEDEFTRASCRSIPEFHITHALDECAELLVHHGGHAMAAGFTVRNRDLPLLEKRIKEIAARQLADLDLVPVLRADLEISLKDLKADILLEQERLEPAGQDNPEVQFITRALRPVRWKQVGNENQHLKLTLADGPLTFDAIAFRQGEWADHMPKLIDVLYSFEKNSFMGRETLQLNVKDIKVSEIIQAA
jgi:single-stranded-DNA-specific exonuclease